MSRLLLATTNPGKQREFIRLLDGIPGRLLFPQDVGLHQQVAEPHHTYAENAAEKAVAFCRASGVPTLADDSGLEVAALEWGPGVRTGRFGGPDASDPVGLILERLRGVEDRRARMVCWLALAEPRGDHDPAVDLFSGVMEGTVAAEKRGHGGFGYDPIFELPSGLTTAELPDAEKDRISHRGRAVQAALPRLRELLTAGP
ncbi:MAG TPA: non-canonical purine NTP pyrophosphatase [Candidatus Limnocylindria bacterium]|nr:non-canonical purine NTP pyrophosphatase [Candidatus Limnocylindria bacterium]